MPNIGTRRILLLGTENSDGTVTGVTIGTSQPINCEGRGYITIYFRSVGTTSGGTVLVEEADYGDKEGGYTGTWSATVTQSASGFTGTVQLANHLGAAAYGYLRVRISATITGGGSILVSMRDIGVS